MKRTTILIPVLLLLSLGATAGDPAPPVDVPLIQNGAVPVNGVTDLELEEMWRAGGEDDEEVFFGVITQVEHDDAGNVYLLDTQLCQVMVFDETGAMTGTLSREGEGPGEVRIPADMCFQPDGTLGLMQSFPGKITKVTLEDVPAGVLEPGGGAAGGGFLLLRDINTSGANLVCCGELIKPNEAQTGQLRTFFLTAYDEAGEEVVDFIEKTREWVFADGDFVWNEEDEYSVAYRKWDVGPDGRVYAAVKRYDYEIHVWNPDGTYDKVITREYESWKRTADENELVERGMENLKRQFGGIPVEAVTMDTEPDVTSLFVHPNGELWVLPSRGEREQDDYVHTTYDVFDADGRFDRQVRVILDAESREDALIFTGEDRAVLVTGFLSAVLTLQGAGGGEEEEDAAPMEVICYSVR